jgi:hypothetical protein
MYDILILAAKKDFENLQYLYDSLVHLQPAYNNVYCVVPEFPAVLVKGIEYRLEKEVLDVPLPRFMPDWIYQQYIKLLQATTIDKYLVIDADIVFNKDIQIFTNDVPNFLISNSTINRPFFKWIMAMFGMERTFDKSFISEMMLFDRLIISKIIPDKEEFVSRSNPLVTYECFPSEYELYGNYVYRDHREMYNYLSVKISPEFLFINFKGSLEEFITSQKDSVFDILALSR